MSSTSASGPAAGRVAVGAGSTAGEWGAAPAALRLLIVDDSAPVGRALARIARGLGWVVDAVTSWSEGQMLLRRARYHFLLVDYGLDGEITGAEAIGWARLSYRGMPAALMSGGLSAAAAAAAIDCPVLVKPFSRDEFAAQLESAARAAGDADPSAVHGEGKETAR